MDDDEDRDDPDEGNGDESAYDGLAIDHLNSEPGQEELAVQVQEVATEKDEEVTV